MSLHAGIDLGTQSVKLLAYDAERRHVVACVSAPLQMIARDDGTREQLGNWWLDAVGACFSKLGPELRRQIVSIGVSGQQHGFVAIDEVGRVLAPVKLWCDTATQQECAQIVAAMGGQEACIAATGNALLTGYTASKVRWMRDHRADAYRQMRTILLPHDYLNFFLTGERFTELGDASGTGWLDVRSLTWSGEALAAIDPMRDLGACLPRIAQIESLLPVTRDAAAEFGIPTTARVSVGGGDNMMAAIGTGNLSEGELTLSLGTSGTLFAYSDRPVVDPQGRWAAFCSSSGGWLPLICTMNCTASTEATAHLLGKSTRDLDRLLANTPPGASGITMLPFFNGERTPDLPQAKASLFGLDAANATDANVLRASMEGATYSLRNGMDALALAGLEFSRVRLTGGGSHSLVWRQMVADVFDLPVDVPQQAEGAALGAALQGFWACCREAGDRRSMAELLSDHVANEEAFGCTPNASAVEQYRHHYGQYLRYQALMMQYHAG